MTAFAFLAAAAAAVTKGRNRPVENPDVVETSRIDRLERELRDAQKRNDVYLGAIERLQKDAADLMRQRDLAIRQRDQITDHLTGMDALQTRPPAVNVGRWRESAGAARLLDLCNCVPARSDALRAAGPNQAVRVE